MPEQDENNTNTTNGGAGDVHSRLSLSPRQTPMNDISAPRPLTPPAPAEAAGQVEATPLPSLSPEPVQGAPAAVEEAPKETPVAAEEPMIGGENFEVHHDKPVEEVSPTPAAAAKPKGSKLWVILAIAFALLAIGAAFAAFLLAGQKSGLQTQNATLKNQLAALEANPQDAVQKQTDALLQKVGRQTALPVDEAPTVALVSDANAARQQSAFFKDAQNGDNVLMYVKAGKAILYRPSTDKVILVAPLTFNAKQ